MKYVEIYRLEKDGQKKVAECQLEGTEVKIVGDPGMALMLSKEGIINYSDAGEQRFFPKDGEKFLEQLKFYFRSGYLNASEIKEK